MVGSEYNGEILDKSIQNNNNNYNNDKINNNGRTTWRRDKQILYEYEIIFMIAKNMNMLIYWQTFFYSTVAFLSFIIICNDIKRYFFTRVLKTNQSTNQCIEYNSISQVHNVLI